MKKINIVLSILWLSIHLNAQTFQTTIKNVGRTLEIYIRPDVTVSTGFAAMEFFIRYPSSQVLTFSNFQANTNATTGFPGATFNVNELTPASLEASYNSIHIGFVQNVTPTTTTSYTGGQEYKVCSIDVAGSVSAANLQIVHNSSFSPYYVSLADHLSRDVAPVSDATYFYPTTSTGAGDLKFYALDVVLPLNLLEFTAQATYQTAFLTWKTADERNVSHFEIERSTNVKHWEKIGSQKAGTEGYHFTDTKAFDKTNAPYYRLKMVDNDGSFTYSPIRQVTTEKTNGLKIYPNPARTTLNVEGIEATETWQLIDVVGRVRATFIGQKELDLTAYTEGVYFIKTASGKFSQFVIAQ